LKNAFLNTTNVGTMKLLWKIKVNSTPRQMQPVCAAHRLGHDAARCARLAILPAF
jgi:hypothetical protein